MRVLSFNDEAKLQDSISQRSAFGARDQEMITLFVATGLRVAEMTGLRVEQVCGAKPEGQGRMVRHTLALPAELAKGGRPRDIPLNLEARQAVARILSFNHQRGFSVAPGAPLFPNRKHQAMSTRAVRRMLSNHCQRAELDIPVSPHGLRHTYCSRLIDQGTPVHQVKRLAGHVRLSSTECYLHSTPEQLAASVARLSRV